MQSKSINNKAEPYYTDSRVQVLTALAVVFRYTMRNIYYKEFLGQDTPLSMAPRHPQTSALASCVSYCVSSCVCLCFSLPYIQHNTVLL